MKANSKRLFTAIDLPSFWLEAIELAGIKLREQGVRGRFVPQERLHLTLNFIGQTTRQKEIQKLLADLDRALPPLISPGQGGLFRRRRGGDLVVWRIGADPVLSAYQKAEAEALAAIGFRSDRLTYLPHLTLVRDARGGLLDSPELASVFGSPHSFLAEELVLYWSRFVDGKLVYTPLCRFPFGRGRGSCQV